MRVGLIALMLLSLTMSVGCGSRPVSKTIHAVKKMHNTAGKVYRATKAVVGIVNPLEYIYVGVDADGSAIEADGDTPVQIRVYDRQTGELVGVIDLADEPGAADAVFLPDKDMEAMLSEH